MAKRAKFCEILGVCGGGGGSGYIVTGLSMVNISPKLRHLMPLKLFGVHKLGSRHIPLKVPNVKVDIHVCVLMSKT